MPTADLPPDLLARAEACGLVRGRAWWSRGTGPVALVWLGEGRINGQWCWAPESTPVGSEPAKGGTEAEALEAAVAWLESGEPEVTS